MFATSANHCESSNRDYNPNEGDKGGGHGPDSALALLKLDVSIILDEVENAERMHKTMLEAGLGAMAWVGQRRCRYPG